MPGSARPSRSRRTGPAARGPDLAVEPERADRPAELHRRPAAPALVQPLQVAAELVGPRRDLQPERDRRAGLGVGAPGHHRAPVPRGQAGDRTDERGAGRGDELADVTHRQREPGVGQVLHRGAVVHVLGGVGRQDPSAAPGSGPAWSARCAASRRPGSRGRGCSTRASSAIASADDAGIDAERRPARRPARRGCRATAASGPARRTGRASRRWPTGGRTRRCRSGGRPCRVRIDGPGARGPAGPARGCAPHGTTATSPSISMRSSSRQHLVSSGPGAGGQGSSGRCRGRGLRARRTSGGSGGTGRSRAASSHVRRDARRGSAPRRSPSWMPPPRQGSSTTVASGGERFELDQLGFEHHRRQVLGDVQHPLRLVEQLGGMRRHDLAHPDAHGVGVEQEADVAVAALDDDARTPGCSTATLASCEGTPVSMSGRRTIDRLVRKRQHLHGRGRREQRLRSVGSTPTRAVASAVAHDHVARAPVALPPQEVLASGSRLSAGRRPVRPRPPGRRVDAGWLSSTSGPAAGAGRRGRERDRRVGPQPEPQRLEPRRLARRHVRQVDVGADAADEPCLLVLAGRLEHAAGRAPTRRAGRRRRRRGPSRRRRRARPCRSPAPR